MMNRRLFLGVIACVFSGMPSASRSQQRRIYRIGYLHPTDATDVLYPAFMQALKGLGYVVGEIR
jgi:hypothetical protein